MICFFFQDRIAGANKVRYSSDRLYRVLQCARLVICFSEDMIVGGLKHASLVIGLIEYYGKLG